MTFAILIWALLIIFMACNMIAGPWLFFAVIFIVIPLTALFAMWLEDRLQKLQDKINSKFHLK